MQQATVLVLTTVHHPDDPRIREKLIRTLATDLDVVFAAKAPGPSDRTGLRWLPLRGGRVRRNLAAWGAAFSQPYEILSLHDPELLPLGLAATWMRRRKVVFDVHENVPELVTLRTWVPTALRFPLRWLLRSLLTIAERSLVITLAEPAYQALFARHHLVFPNFLTSALPSVRRERDGYAVYVGDVTEERGLATGVAAAAQAHIPLRVVGRVTEEFQASLGRVAEAEGGVVVFTGRLPHREAMKIVAGAVVGLSPIRDLPNYRHSLPTKVLEYLALGVPVVATDLPGTRSALSGLSAVELVPPDDPVEMAAAMKRTAAEVEAAIDQAEAVRNRFRWPADEVHRFYLALLGPDVPQ